MLWPRVCFIFFLSFSGFAALINQVVWQRGLAKYLGGIESQSSMIVVMVFMGGLSLGAHLMGRRAAERKNPLKTLAYVEFLLAFCNLLISFLLAADLSSSLGTVHIWLFRLGLPLSAFYALTAIVLLLLPCFLMGATMPLASESGQRQMKLQDARFIPVMFTLNTLGSVAGAFVGGWFLMPLYGLRLSLYFAVACNVLAGLCFLYYARLPAAVPNIPEEKPEKSRSVYLTLPVILAFGFGLVSLAYEMLLLRIFAVLHQPLPTIFSTVIALFLLCWSIGSALSSYQKEASLRSWTSIAALMLLAAFGVSFVPELKTSYLYQALFFLPCVCFGYLFGLLTRSESSAWGEHVGHITASNTIGSCVGLLLITLVFFEGFSPASNLLTLCGGMGILFCLQLPKTRRKWAAGLALVGVLGCSWASASVEPLMRRAAKMYYSKTGVVGVTKRGHMFWDGLWHSALSRSQSHIDTNNWYMGALPLMFSSTEPKRVAIIGLGTGITAATVAKLKSVERVDVYEINRRLKQLLVDYPKGTLHILKHPKVRIFWQDARIGLALRKTSYDLIVTQPVYLKQSGSSYINSKEFLSLVRRRLTPRGIFALYSNGTGAQAFAMRQTARQVFPHRETFMNGYLMLLSKKPFLGIQSYKALDEKLRRPGPLWQEFRMSRTVYSALELLLLLDVPRLNAAGTQFTITDNSTHLEHPKLLQKAMAKALDKMTLPTPSKPFRRKATRSDLRFLLSNDPPKRIAHPVSVSFGRFLRFDGYDVAGLTRGRNKLLLLRHYYYVEKAIPAGCRLFFALSHSQTPRYLSLPHRAFGGLALSQLPAGKYTHYTQRIPLPPQLPAGARIQLFQNVVCPKVGPLPIFEVKGKKVERGPSKPFLFSELPLPKTPARTWQVSPWKQSPPKRRAAPASRPTTRPASRPATRPAPR